MSSSKILARSENGNPDVRIYRCRRRADYKGLTTQYARQKYLNGSVISESSVVCCYDPRVATITALIVCKRFSASSKTMECFDSKTSSVTSIPSRPNFL
jgi:hypothetical protein